MLYKVVYVYLLNHTDIRPVHHSLFDRKDCLGIHGVAYVHPTCIASVD